MRFAIALPLALAAWGALLATPAGASPPALTVTLSGSPTGTVVAGDTITYTVTIDNSGTTGSGPVTVGDDLPGVYVADSATCGTVSGCTVNASTPAVACPIFPAGTNTGICGARTSISWTITSVPGGDVPLTVSTQMTVLTGHPVSDSAEWSGDGCAVSFGCQTNTVTNPIADVTVTQSRLPANGTPVVAGQSIGYTLLLANVGEVPSGPITVEDNIPVVGGSSLVPGSANCGAVAGCTVSVAPMATCAAGPCPGSAVTWVLPSVPAGATGLDLSFSVGVNASATDAIVNQTMWNGSISPPIEIVRTQGIPRNPVFSSGDGCVFIPDVVGGSGCLLAFDSNPVTPTTTTTTTTTTTKPPVVLPTTTTTRPGIVTASSRSLAFTGPGSGIRWTGLLGIAVSILGLSMLLGRRRLFGAAAHAAAWLLGRSA